MKDLEISATRRGDKISWKAAQRKELSTVKTRKEFYVIHELFKGTLVVFQSNQNWWVMHQFLDIGKGTYFTEDFHGTSSLFWVMDWFQEERRKIKPGKQSFKHQRILLEMTQRKKSLMMTTQFHRKHLMSLVGNLTTMQYTGYDCRKRRIKDWNSGRRSHLQAWPGDCIDRVTSQNGDRANFKRLETPRPAPKVTFKKNWHSHQQQHSTSGTDVLNFWKREAKKGRTRLEHKTLRTTSQKQI